MLINQKKIKYDKNYFQNKTESICDPIFQIQHLWSQNTHKNILHVPTSTHTQKVTETNIYVLIQKTQ